MVDFASRERPAQERLRLAVPPAGQEGEAERVLGRRGAPAIRTVMSFVGGQDVALGTLRLVPARAQEGDAGLVTSDAATVAVVIFFDGFESGDTIAWSASVP